MRKKRTIKILAILIVSLISLNLIYINKSFAEVLNGEAVSVDIDANQEASTEESENQNNDNSTNIIQIIKKAVAKWYYIMRLVVIALMLVFLIAIGIKMAISTASEKALYKQMLVDWVVGMIVVFSIHYIMIFILNVNDSIVEILEKMSHNAQSLQDEYEYGDMKDKEVSEMEMTIYESARTRAYSLKMTDGFFGMIVYGVLVFYAWKFALIYLKRLMNIIILTLLAPLVAGSYAINKVMTGKSKIFSTWLSEYIMNVIIQIIHALMYVTFVAIAFQLAMQSLPGIILAFILIHFMGKCEQLLRQLFKLSGSDGLGKDMADNTNFAQLKQDIKTQGAMLGAVGTKKAAGMFYGTLAIPGKAIGNFAFGKTMETIANSQAYQKHLAKKEEERLDKWENGEERAVAELQKQRDKLVEKQKELEQEKQWHWNNQDEQRLNDTLQKINENNKKLKENEQEIQDAREEFKLSLMKKETIRGNIAKAFNPKKYVEFDGKKYRRIKTKHEDGAFWHGTKESAGKRLKEELKVQKILGMNDKEMKILKSELKFSVGMVTGLFQGIAGMATLGVNPSVGMALMAIAINKGFDIRKRRKRYKLKQSYKLNSNEVHTYKFKRFSKGARKLIVLGATLVSTEQEKLEFIHNQKLMKAVQKNYTDYNNFKADRAAANYRKAYEQFEQNVQNQLENQKLEDLMIGSTMKKFGDRAVNIDGNVVKINKDDKLEEFYDKIDNIDKDKTLTREEQLTKFKEVLEKDKYELVKRSLERLCVNKGIQNIDDLGDLSIAEQIAVKASCLNILEVGGYIKTGELNIKDMGITNDDIVAIHADLKHNKDDTNIDIQEMIVQDSVLEYVTKTGETDIKKLQTDEAKEQICNIVIDKTMSEDSKKTDEVLQSLFGQRNEETGEKNNKGGNDNSSEEEQPIAITNLSKTVKNTTVVSEIIKKLLDKTLNNTETKNKSDLKKEAKEIGRDKLEEKLLTSETNELKSIVTENVYTGNREETTETAQYAGVLADIIAEIENSNKEVLEVQIKKKKRKNVNRALIDEQLELYNEKLNQSDNISESDDNLLEKNDQIEDVVTRIYGPVTDIVDLINSDGINKYK